MTLPCRSRSPSNSPASQAFVNSSRLMPKSFWARFSRISTGLFFGEHTAFRQVFVSYRLWYVGIWTISERDQFSLSRLQRFILSKFASEVPELTAYGILTHFSEKGSFTSLLVPLKLLQRPLETLCLRLGDVVLSFVLQSC